jgi:hypothetical protein
VQPQHCPIKKAGIKMKYHLKNRNGNAICGAVADRPDTFLYNVDGFKNHYAKECACKKCTAILNKMGQPTQSNWPIETSNNLHNANK